MYNPSAKRIAQGWIHRFRFAAAIVAAVLCLPATTATAQAPDDVKPDTKSERSQPARSPISVGDDVIDQNQTIKPEFTITVMVAGEAEASGNYRVDPQGNISIRYAGAVAPVSLKEMTPQLAQDAIAAYLKTFIKNPSVRVSIFDVPKQSVFVGGSVRNPGVIYINSDTTLLDVITRAEYNDASDLSQVMIVRKDLPKPFYVNFEQFIRSPRDKVDDKENPVLHDKDRIWVVSRNVPGAVGSISVFGEVTHPMAAIPLRTSAPISVREAINLAGGALPTADRKRVSIQRAGIDRPLIVDLDRAETGDLINNIELKSDDKIYVEKLETNAYINLTGGFAKPGKLVYDKKITLTQAVAEVGGMAQYAKSKEVTIFRHPDNDPAHTRVITFNYQDILRGKAQDIELAPGDTINVELGGPPRSKPGVFDVLGALGSLGYLLHF